MRDFQDIKVWEKSHRLTLEVYKVTASFPQGEIYGLTSQLRRACASIPTNIAEGCGRKGDAALARFMQVAMGSTSEVEDQLLLARDLSFTNQVEYERPYAETVEVKKMQAAFLVTLRRKADKLIS